MIRNLSSVNSVQYAFSRKSSIVQHQRIQTGENPYKCKECTVPNSNNLTVKILCQVFRRPEQSKEVVC